MLQSIIQPSPTQLQIFTIVFFNQWLLPCHSHHFTLLPFQLPTTKHLLSIDYSVALLPDSTNTTISSNSIVPYFSWTQLYHTHRISLQIPHQFIYRALDATRCYISASCILSHMSNKPSPLLYHHLTMCSMQDDADSAADYSPLGLIRASLSNKERSWHG